MYTHQHLEESRCYSLVVLRYPGKRSSRSCTYSPAERCQRLWPGSECVLLASGDPPMRSAEKMPALQSGGGINNASGEFDSGCSMQGYGRHRRGSCLAFACCRIAVGPVGHIPVLATSVISSAFMARIPILLSTTAALSGSLLTTDHGGS